MDENYVMDKIDSGASLLVFGYLLGCATGALVVLSILYL